jgi:hypothetical protein
MLSDSDGEAARPPKKGRKSTGSGKGEGERKASGGARGKKRGKDNSDEDVKESKGPCKEDKDGYRKELMKHIGCAAQLIIDLKSVPYSSECPMRIEMQSTAK